MLCNGALKRMFDRMLEQTAKWGTSLFVPLTKHYQSDQVQRIVWAGHVARVGKLINL